jgi:hypothetical protein
MLKLYSRYSRLRFLLDHAHNLLQRQRFFQLVALEDDKAPERPDSCASK